MRNSHFKHNNQASLINKDNEIYAFYFIIILLKSYEICSGSTRFKILKYFI